jgi:hypothetical protein
VDVDAAGAALDFWVVVGPLVREVGVELDRGGVLGVDRAPEGAGGVEGLAGQHRATLGALARSEFGEFGGVGFLDPVGGFPLGDDVVAVGAGLLRGEVAALVRGPGEDFIGRGAFRGALVAQLVEQVGHRCSWSISH